MTAQIQANGPVFGVSTTKIYCRTVCRRGGVPRRENCIPFLTAKDAQRAGYRACKKCRPDDISFPTRTVTSTARTPELIRLGVGLTPVGFVCVASTEKGLCALYLIESDDPTPVLQRLHNDHPRATIVADPRLAEVLIPEINDYLEEGRIGESLTLDLRGTTFQLRVWEALRAIPRGATTTYGALAQSLGLAAGAARAVGGACGANRISLLVPCHRVVRAGSQGLGGYFWGLEKKRALLALEGVSSFEVEPRARDGSRARVVT
jgi:AraC family transcriptional regulator of adaptative response/methylated-DNA-[protein]-cysteine methyltransferase